MQVVSTWVHQEHEKRWKLWLLCLSNQIASDFSSLDTGDKNEVVWFITENYHLRKHMHRLGIFTGRLYVWNMAFKRKLEHLIFEWECRSDSEILNTKCWESMLVNYCLLSLSFHSKFEQRYSKLPGI